MIEIPEDLKDKITEEEIQYLPSFLIRERFDYLRMTPEEQAAHDEKVEREQAEKDKAEHDEWVRRGLANVPRRFRHGKIEHPQIRAYCENYFEPGSGLLIAGPVGTGKTHSLWGIYRFCAMKPEDFNLPTIFKTHELIDSTKPGAEKDLTYEASNDWLVMLDDIGAQKMTEWAEDRLFAVVDERYERQLNTVVTTNARPKNLANQVGSRIASRLTEMCEVVTLTGKDRRQS